MPLKRRTQRPFPHIQRIVRRSPDGSTIEYCYHRQLRVRLQSAWGTPEFAAEYAALKKAPSIRVGRPPSVYFIQAVHTRHIKIGQAAFPEKRLQGLQISCPDELVLLGSIPDPSGGSLERVLHRQFSAHHVRGEWFRESPELVAFLRERGFTTVPTDAEKFLHGTA